MAKPIWQQKLQAKLDANPLFWEEPTKEEKAANPNVATRIRCEACGGKGKKLTLRYITNYSHFNTCDYCKRTVR